ncbi:MAG: hypothetical protein QXP91_10655 [Candidatus Methanomethylicia archaeon]
MKKLIHPQKIIYKEEVSIGKLEELAKKYDAIVYKDNNEIRISKRGKFIILVVYIPKIKKYKVSIKSKIPDFDREVERIL